MAMFSRRTIQRLINENVLFINEEQSASHIRKLNEGDLSFEWEVVLLNVFSKIGTVIHEPSFENSSRKIDILFSTQDANKVEFLADIVTISDSFAEKENPVEYLDDKLLQIKLKNNLPGGFGLHIAGNTAQATFLRKKQELFIPTKTDFDKELFNKDIKSFIKKVIRFPNQEDELYIKRDGINLRIIYSLSRIISSSHPSYKEIIDLEDNSVFKTLIRKYKQLKETNYQGHLGIFICDGDCQSLKDFSASWYGKTSGDVIRRFLKKKTKVSFVLILYIEQSFSYGVKNKIVCKLFTGINFDNRLEVFFSHLEKDLRSLFPIPERNASNAINFMKAESTNEGASFFGGGEIGGDRIKISSRTMLDLLAGKITYEEFPEFYKEFFQRKLSEGKLIESVNFEREIESDDDWLIFKFGNQDPAISSYKSPNQPNNT